MHDSVYQPLDHVLTTYITYKDEEFNEHTEVIYNQDPVGDREGERYVPAHGILATRLLPLKPNPFNFAADISYSLGSQRNVLLQLYDVKGRLVATLVNSRQSPGIYRLRWNSRRVSSGLYFLRFSAGRYRSELKAIIIK
jgi:hypothetical protein